LLEVAREWWPTPQASDYRWPNRNPGSRSESTVLPQSSHSLAAVVMRRLWPTPGAEDVRDRGNLSTPAIQRRFEKGKQLNLSMVVSEKSGALNPTWVEWLMGYPIGWTDLEDSATP
jgi:DNA (cytosine-5)-methyltransferase 1